MASGRTRPPPRPDAPRRRSGCGSPCRARPASSCAAGGRSSAPTPRRGEGQAGRSPAGTEWDPSPVRCPRPIREAARCGPAVPGPIAGLPRVAPGTSPGFRGSPPTAAAGAPPRQKHEATRARHPGVAGLGWPGPDARASARRHTLRPRGLGRWRVHRRPDRRGRPARSRRRAIGRRRRRRVGAMHRGARRGGGTRRGPVGPIGWRAPRRGTLCALVLFEDAHRRRSAFTVRSPNAVPAGPFRRTRPGAARLSSAALHRLALAARAPHVSARRTRECLPWM